MSSNEHVRTVRGASVARQRETSSSGGKRAAAPNLCTYLSATSVRPLPTSMASTSVGECWPSTLVQPGRTNLSAPSYLGWGQAWGWVLFLFSSGGVGLGGWGWEVGVVSLGLGGWGWGWGQDGVGAKMGLELGLRVGVGRLRLGLGSGEGGGQG